MFALRADRSLPQPTHQAQTATRKSYAKIESIEESAPGHCPIVSRSDDVDLPNSRDDPMNRFPAIAANAQLPVKGLACRGRKACARPVAWEVDGVNWSLPEGSG